MSENFNPEEVVKEFTLEKRLAIPMEDIETLVLKEGDHLSLMIEGGKRLIELDITSIAEERELLTFVGKDQTLNGDETTVTYNKTTKEFREA